MSDESVLMDIQKGQEGFGLALAAVADVLNKMNDREDKLETAKNDAADADEQEAADKEKDSEIQKAVDTALLKAGVTPQGGGGQSDAGLEVDPSPKNAKYSGSGSGAGQGSNGGTSTAGGSSDVGDGETPVNETTDIKDQQAVIQASHDDKDHDDDDDKDSKGDKDSDSQRYPEEMSKAIADLTSQVTALTNGEGIQAAIEKGVDARLSGMGFKRESNNSAQLINPTLNPLGADGAVEIKKGEEFDLVDALADLDHSTLAKMREQVESGNLDGLPQEVVEAVSR